MSFPRSSSLFLVALLLTACRSGSGSGGNRPAVERGVNAVTAPRSQGSSRRVAPDAGFVNLRYASLGLAPGGSSTVELDVINRGEQPTGPLRVGIYASPGRVVTANRTLLGSVELGSVTNAGPQHVVIPITAPGSPGSYAIGVDVDDRRQVAGDDRANNTSGPSQLLVR